MGRLRDRARQAYAAWATFGRKEQFLLDYPAPHDPRWGFGQPLNGPLLARLEPAVAPALDLLRRHGGALALDGVPDTAAPGTLDPSWTTGYVSPLDGAVLCAVLAEHRPARYVEIGSGTSTKFARRTVDLLGLPTTLCSIDPQPRAEVDALCDEVVRADLQTVGLDRFEELGPGDVVFFDGSHRALMASDVAVFFFEVLPRLAPGVLVHVHDVFLPADYPPEWRHRSYSEQYVVGAALLGDPSLEVLSPNHLLSLTAADELAAWWDGLGVGLPAQPAYDNSLWLRTSAAG